LAELGFELVCFDRASSPQWPDGTKAIIGDFATLPVELLEVLDNALVFHLVSSCRPTQSTVRVVEEVSIDVVTTLRYLEATKARNLRWVFLSSGGTVYGQQDCDRIVETVPTEPICSYGLVKITTEKYFALYRKLHGLDYVIARLANPFGPWQHPLRGQGIIAALTYKALKGETVEIWGDGSNVRDYIYIADAIQGILAIACAGKSGEMYNIGTSIGLSINQVIEKLGNSLKLKLKVNYTATRSVDVRVLDIVKINSHTGWNPLITIDSGMELTASWMARNLDFL
jgi:UDP-glucose 4-epimerase